MSPDAVLAPIAQFQHALLTHRQARQAGLSDWAVAHRLDRGRWIRKRRGVYAIAGAPPSERQEVLAAQLAAGDGALAARLTASGLWRLGFPGAESIHLLGPRRRLEGVTSHQTGTLVPADTARLGALALTSVARTIVDCAGTVTPVRLGRIVDDALRRGVVRLDDLRACHARADTGPGRRPTVALREVLEVRQPGFTPGDSVAEADVVAFLTRRGVPAPVFGHRVKLGRRRYKLDAAWPEHLLGIEFDSWAFHRMWSSFHDDRDRNRRLTVAGWTVLLVTAQTDLGELADDLLRLLTWREPAA